MTYPYLHKMLQKREPREHLEQRPFGARPEWIAFWRERLNVQVAA